MRLGIDFGTTRTVVAAAIDGRYPVASFDIGEAFHDFVPGLVLRDGEDALSFGWEAARSIAEAPAGGLRSLKRAIGRVRPDERLERLGGSALDVTTAYLSHLRRLVVERSNLRLGEDEPLEAMVAVPANASTRQRYLTLEAFHRAGFEVIGMVNEPTAAALEYAHRELTGVGPRSPKRYVLVYDLGGGTFDVSGVSLIEHRFEVLASEGIAELGGDDIDAALLALALERLGLTIEQVPLQLRPALLETCREVKEGIGPSAKRILVDLSALLPVETPAVLAAAELYERTMPLVERTVAVLERVLAGLEGHGIDPDDPRQLAAIYLVGGSVSFPAVGRALRERWARKLKLAPQPYAATAVGLAIAADPESAVQIAESTTRCFGVWREAEQGREKVFDPIFSKDLPLTGGEIVVERRYRPVHRVGHLRFMECSRFDERGEPTGDLVPAAVVRFPYDPTFLERGLGEAPAGPGRVPSGDEIIERYTYEPDGRIWVLIRNATSGYEARYALLG